MIIAVDFDGTCVDHVYPNIGVDVPFAVETMKRLINSGHKIILWTMRSGKELKEAENWFKGRNIELFGVQRNPEQDKWTKSPKCYASLYIDDAAFGCPLISIDGFNRRCVDWKVVMKYFFGEE